VGKLYTRVSDRQNLERAWRKVREHALTSTSHSTHQALIAFEKSPLESIAQLRKRLTAGNFQFAPQLGVLKRKQDTSEYRPLVVAPLEDRIIQRAILDVMTDDVPAVQKILSIPTSVGGMRTRGVASAMKYIMNAIDDGGRYFLRSDIANFFTKIPKEKVNEFAAAAIRDRKFLSLFESALKTELQNLSELGEHKSLFPIGNDGVAQGSALSTLAGNIVLQDFDHVLNERNIVCVRYIDDFIILGPNESTVKKAFASAQELLGQLNMVAYVPGDGNNKAECGYVGNGFSFLGCYVNATVKLIQPARKNRKSLLKEIDQFLEQALQALRWTSNTDQAPTIRQRYAQTLVKLDGIISGWGHAFQFCNCGATFDSLDNAIDQKINRFNRGVKNLLRANSPRASRRILGVQLLRDIPMGAIGSWPSR
jgi:RNA-directed DNA polymerase